jgi:hypothetical protein
MIKMRIYERWLENKEDTERYITDPFSELIAIGATFKVFLLYFGIYFLWS